MLHSFPWDLSNISVQLFETIVPGTMKRVRKVRYYLLHSSCLTGETELQSFSSLLLHKTLLCEALHTGQGLLPLFQGPGKHRRLWLMPSEEPYWKQCPFSVTYPTSSLPYFGGTSPSPHSSLPMSHIQKCLSKHSFWKNLFTEDS